MANDPTVKAGSWGARTVEKIVRLTEYALRHELPVVWLVDSAGARLTDQVQLFPGRRGAGRIFANQVRLSGKVPQVCCLFGPSAAGGAYIPSFCDVVFMVEGNASMYLGSPRMAEEVIGEVVTLEEMGGARMHATVSGCGDNLVPDDAHAIEMARLFLSYLPRCFRDDPPPTAHWSPPGRALGGSLIPDDERRGYDMHRLIEGLVDEDSFFELKPQFAPELIIGFARMEGDAIGIVANNPAAKGGVLFVDSADKAARFIWLCDAFNVPLVFLADVPGFMIGSQVEREGIIRHGAKMITAVTEATVPKVCVVVRKAYGAGLYAMCGPAFDPDAVLALPTAKIAVMGPEPAINAVYYNRIQALTDPDARAAFVAEQRRVYEEDVDLLRLAADLVVDAVVQPEDLRHELVARIGLAMGKSRHLTDRRHGVPPV
jgi:acetyl-CoA carboxylase carboxyltransferase component